jgi:hypothetical protein
MKVILDGNPADFGQMLNLLFRTTQQNPTQKPGRGNSMKEAVGGKRFEVIRNIDSYTVKGPTK